VNVKGRGATEAYRRPRPFSGCVPLLLASWDEWRAHSHMRGALLKCVRDWQVHAVYAILSADVPTEVLQATLQV
jgi:hypothetical protein